jgi:rubrerythrin
MPELRGSKTHENLREAFAGESQANRRYIYFAQKADVEGQPDIAALFRSVSEGETGHAFGHFDFLAEVGDPVTSEPVGATTDNLKSAIAGETYEYTEMYPGFARTARDEGFEDIAEWLETLARAEKSHASRSPLHSSRSNSPRAQDNGRPRVRVASSTGSVKPSSRRGPAGSRRPFTRCGTARRTRWRRAGSSAHTHS